MFLRKNKILEQFIIEQISIAPCFSDSAVQCAVIVYKSGGVKGEFNYIVTSIPKSGTFRYEDIINIIKNAAHVDLISCKDKSGRAKPIYVLRNTSGKIFDIVERDYTRDRFIGNFSEIAMTDLRLELDDISGKRPQNTVLSCKIKALKSNYTAGTPEYALINACNACLLGNIFDSDEFDMVTYDGEKVKLEVRLSNYISNEEDVISVSPAFDNNGCCKGNYATEKFECIDVNGDRIRYAYALVYDALNGCYTAERI